MRDIDVKEIMHDVDVKLSVIIAICAALFTTGTVTALTLGGVIRNIGLCMWFLGSIGLVVSVVLLIIIHLIMRIVILRKRKRRNV